MLAFCTSELQAGDLHHLSILLECFHDVHTRLFGEDQHLPFKGLLQGLLPSHAHVQGKCRN